jgi:hypothetical protein
MITMMSFARLSIDVSTPLNGIFPPALTSPQSL